MTFLLCGAKDINEIASGFAAIAEDFNAKPMHFLNATISYDNSKGWIANSERSVSKADVVVYVILRSYGEITWQTEYITAKNNGKPFIVLCLEEVWDLYKASRAKTVKAKSAKSQTAKIFNVLDILMHDNISPAPFTHDNFRKILKEQLTTLFENAIDALGERHRRDSLIELIKKEDIKNLKSKIESNFSKPFLIEILIDPFEPKGIRKIMLDYFAYYDSLTTDIVKKLIGDNEQGVSRKAIQLLPELVKDKKELGDILDALIEEVKDADDSGTTRRAITAMLSMDIELVLPYLLQLFPATDIGTPKRILSYLNEHLDEITNNPNFLKFQKEFEELRLAGRNYGESGTVKELSQSIENKLKDKGLI